MKKSNGVTLIALIITVIILLILAGVVIAMTIGDEGIINKSQQAVNKYNESQAREKLEMVLLDLQTDKVADPLYNDKEYIDNKIRQNSMKIEDDIVTVGEWQFMIDRDTLKIDENQRKPSIIVKTVDVAGDKINISIELRNQKQGNITYIIIDRDTNQEIARKEKITELNHTFTNLQEGKKYEIRIELESNDVIEMKIINVDNIKNLVPKLTQITPQIIHSSNATIDDSNQWGHYNLYYAFDDNDNTCESFSVPGNASIGEWVGYDFERPVKVEKVTGKIRMLGYKIQYSDDLVIWKDAVASDSTGGGDGNDFSNNISPEIGAHRYWRLYVNGGQLESNWSPLIYTLRFFGGAEIDIQKSIYKEPNV